MRHTAFFAAGLIAVTLGVSACESTSPSSAVSLTGTIRETSSNAAIAGATVTVQSKSATTAANGTYTISDLTAGSAEVRVTHQGHTNTTQNVTLSGATTANVLLPVEPRMIYHGNWTGTWTNLTAPNTGPGTMAIAVDTVAQSMQFTIDLGGVVFGIPDPSPITCTNAYTASGLSINVSTLFGTLTATVTPAGQISGNIVVVPGLPVPLMRIDFTGTRTGTTVAINFTLNFTGGGTHTGTLAFSKVS